MKKTAPDEPIESPIPFHVGSNGEVMPTPPSRKDRLAEAMFARLSDEKSRRLGLSRRDFVQSAMGQATALLVINKVYGCSGSETFTVDAGMMEDSGAACEVLTGGEFIFDVQTHHVNPEGTWRSPGRDSGFSIFPYSGCGEADFIDCFDADHYIRELFVNSDTSIAVLSQVPAVPGDSPLENEEAVVTREIVNCLAGSERLITHGIVLPDRGMAQLDGMQSLAETLDIAAWKVYTQFGGGWRLDDESSGIPFIEKARELGIKTICAHKGLPIFGLSEEFASPADIGNAAKMFPDVNFLVYHSGFDVRGNEGPYNPDATLGTDTLVRAGRDAGIGAGGNIYAELGSTWRFIMTAPEVAAHVLGKLLVQFGEDRVLWGTDSIWYGSPQDQIAAFRAFQIPDAMRDEFGYPEITCEIKKKILGLNAAAAYGIDPDATRNAISNDDIANKKLAIADDPALRKPTVRQMGPQTRREFLRYLKLHDGEPL